MNIHEACQSSSKHCSEHHLAFCVTPGWGCPQFPSHCELQVNVPSMLGSSSSQSVTWSLETFWYRCLCHGTLLNSKGDVSQSWPDSHIDVSQCDSSLLSINSANQWCFMSQICHRFPFSSASEYHVLWGSEKEAGLFFRAGPSTLPITREELRPRP